MEAIINVTEVPLLISFSGARYIQQLSWKSIQLQTLHFVHFVHSSDVFLAEHTHPCSVQCKW